MRKRGRTQGMADRINEKRSRDKDMEIIKELRSVIFIIIVICLCYFFIYFFTYRLNNRTTDRAFIGQVRTLRFKIWLVI